VELPGSSLVGGRWKDAMNSSAIIHASTQQELCAELGCGAPT